jgi:hypothetical protein
MENLHDCAVSATILAAFVAKITLRMRDVAAQSAAILTYEDVSPTSLFLTRIGE